MLDRKSDPFRYWRALLRRTKSVTNGQLFLDVLAPVATLCVVIIPIAWALEKVPGGSETWRVWARLPWPVYVYLAAVLFVPIYRTYLISRFRNRRLESLEKDRPIVLSSAIGQLSHLMRAADGREREMLVAHAQRRLLSAILTEVESLVVDTEGVYVEVNLLVPHPTDEDQLRCIERAKSRRDIPKDYAKKGMLAWRCIDEISRQHEPDYEPERGQQYRSILCFPLYVRPPGTDDLVHVFGAVSVDHGKAFEFDGIEDDLEERISPYLRLLEHLFVLQETRIPRDPPPVNKPKRRR